jgi:cytochrome c553
MQPARLRRFLGIGVGSAALFILGGLGGTYGLSNRRLHRVHGIPAERALEPATDSASVERGRHLVSAVTTCTLCHGQDFGGAVYADAGPLGFIAGPNLTSGPGGVGRLHGDADWERAIRHGVRPDGRSLIVMPSEVYVHLSDRDLSAIIGYVRQLPPVDRELPATHFRLLGRALLAAGKLPLLVAEKTPSLAHVSAVEPEPTAAYGRYLAGIGGCYGCHGYGLSGGRVAGPSDLPPAANLTPAGIGSWAEYDFVRAMREGIRPGGAALNDFMPWKIFGGMTDEELHALWLYLGTVPAREFGNK